jgi:ribosomal protein S18 acetylase RimI-like enzyme
LLTIREYSSSDDEEWRKCRLASYFDSSYFDEIIKDKPRYENPVIELIAILDSKIVGILDIEIELEPGQFCWNNKHRSGLITVIGVLPLYRRRGIANKLVKTAFVRTQKKYKVQRLEIWLRNDPGTISWLKQLNFKEIHEYYQIFLSEDFFDKYSINLPFGLNPISMTACVESEGFIKLTNQHPPEKSFKIKGFEKFL